MKSELDQIKAEWTKKKTAGLQEIKEKFNRKSQKVNVDTQRLTEAIRAKQQQQAKDPLS